MCRNQNVCFGGRHTECACYFTSEDPSALNWELLCISRRTRTILFVLAGTLPTSFGICAEPLPARVAIHPSVPLTGSGDASPLIVCPQTGESGLRLGEQIAQALHERFHVQACVVRAGQMDEQQYHQRTVILLGHIVSNPEILWLYSFSYSFADAAYPGGDGYVIRQVYDPVGAGRNALVIGASSPKGLAGGVDRFVREIETLQEPRWTTRLIVESELDVVTRPPAVLDAEAAANLYQESLENMREGELWQEVHRIINSAHLWYLSGATAYLDQYRALTRAHREFAASGQDQIYGGLEFWMAAYIQAWDIVEDAKSWSGPERRQMVELLMELTAILARRYGVDPAGSPTVPRPRWNHETNPAMAYFYLAEYLRKYYDDAEPALRWRAAAERILGDQTRFVRGTDESASYLPYAPSHALRFAFATRNHEMVSSGRARRLGDLLLLMTDSTGRFLGSGNHPRKNIAYYYLLPLATVLQDGRYVGLDTKSRLAVLRPGELRNDWGVQKRFGEYRPPLKPTLPHNEAHVQVVPIEAGLFELTNSEAFYPTAPVVASAVTRSRAFDKLVFRNGYTESSDYLLLDGYGRGKHLRYDTNAIARFTGAGRVFLVDTDDDQRIAEKYHNTLTVIRNGRGQLHVPPYAELETVADLADTGFSRTSVTDYAGLNWTRNIVWLKGRFFAVLDEMEAVQGGDYNLRCHWNGLGALDMNGATLRFEQDGQCCAITNDSPLRVLAEMDVSRTELAWERYPHAQPAIQRVRQTRSQSMKPGDRAAFHNVIYTYPSTKARRITWSSAAAGSGVLSEAGQYCLLFVDPQSVPAPFRTDAVMGMMDDDRIALVRATTLTVNGIDVLRCTGPVDVELNVSQGTATVSQGSRGRLTLTGAGQPHQLLNEKRTLRWAPPQEVREQLAKTIAAVGGVSPPSPAPSRSREVASLKAASSAFKAVETRIDADIRSALALPAATHGNGAIVLATSDSCRGLRIDSQGKPHALWRIESNAAVSALTNAQLRSGTQAVVYGTETGMVVAVGLNGQVLWRHQLTTPSSIERRISCLASGDVDGDGGDEVIVGTHSWNVHCLAGDGHPLWMQPAYAHRVASLAVGDVNGDGASDVLAGTSYYALNAFSGKGDIYFGCRAEPVWRRTIIADLDANGRPEVVAANGSHVIVYDVEQAKIQARRHTKGMNFPRATTERFRFDTGDDVCVLEVADFDSEGKVELVAGSDSGFMYCFDSRGKLLRLQNVGEAVRSLAIGRSRTGEPRIAGGLRDGQVFLLDKALQPLGRGKLGEPPIWLALSDDGNVRCVTKRSVALVLSGESNAE